MKKPSNRSQAFTYDVLNRLASGSSSANSGTFAGITNAFSFNTVKTRVALGQAANLNLPGAVATMMTPLPKPLQPSNTTQAQASTATQVTLTFATAAIPIGGVETAAASGTTSLIGFSTTESAMIGKSMNSLAEAGYDLSPLQQLLRADMPPGCCAMSLSTPPTGAALGDGAFSSQGMLDHTLEEELLHLNQDLPNQTFGPGTAATKEAEVNAARKFPEPQQ